VSSFPDTSPTGANNEEAGFQTMTATQKIYARDFKPGDIPGWPSTASYVYVLRAVHADRPFLRVATAKFPPKLKPMAVFKQSDLDAANICYNVLKTAAGNNVAVGPILLGAAAPVHILTPSTTVRRIVNMTALTVTEANAPA